MAHNQFFKTNTSENHLKNKVKPVQPREDLFNKLCKQASKQGWAGGGWVGGWTKGRKEGRKDSGEVGLFQGGITDL